MAPNTLDLKVRVDTSEVATSMYAAQSMVSGVFGTAQSNITGAASGLAQFASAATGGAAMMYGGLQRGMATVGQYSDPAAAYESHYGMVRAESSLAQEWAAYSGGPASVARMSPPGVGAGDYTRALMENLGQRRDDVVSGFVGGAAPVVAGVLAAKGASMVAGAFKMGMLGSIGLPLAAWTAAEHVVSKGIERGNTIFQEVQELGEIPTAGRGFSVADTHKFGTGLRDIASRMNISKNEMGDIASGIRASGMMPSTRDVEASLQQFEGMAKDIRDVAVGMQTSLGRATQYLKSVEQMGMGRGAGGVFAAASMAEGLGTSLGGLIAHVGMGQQVGRATGIGAGVGGGVFLQSAFAGARGLGALDSEERLMAGGAMGLGRAFGMHAMQNAMGPIGEMQMMAMSRGQGLPGTAMETLDQAAGAMLGSGDPIANMVDFTTNRNRRTRQLGATGIRLMQAQSIQTEAQMLMELSPGMSQQNALQYVAMNRDGMSEINARGIASYIMRGFKDPRPSAVSQGLPGIFGSPGTAERMARASVDTSARAMARTVEEESKWPHTRAIEWIGNKWVASKMEQAKATDEKIQNRLESQGIVQPSHAALKEFTESLRTGEGIASSASIDLRGVGGAPEVLGSILSFAGAQTSGDSGPGFILGSGQRVTAQEASGALKQLSLSIDKEERGRFGKEEWKNIDEAGLNIAVARQEGKLKDKALAGKHMEYNMNRATSGSQKHFKLVEAGMREVIMAGGGPLADELKKNGGRLGGTHMGEMLRVVKRATGIDVGNGLRRMTGAMAAAGGVVIDEAEKKVIAEAIGEKAYIEPVRVEDQVSRRVIDQVDSSAYSAYIADQINKPEPVSRILPVNKNIDIGRQLISSPSYAGLAQSLERARKKYGTSKDATTKVTSDPAVKKATAAFIAEAGKKGDADKLTAAQSIASKITGDDDLRKRIKGMESIVAAKAADSSKTRRRSGGGTAVSFQSGEDSFKGQVASMLRKTAHALNQATKTMSAMEGRLQPKAK